MSNEDELRVKKLQILIKTYTEMLNIYIETAEKLNSAHQQLEAKPYIEQARTLSMVIDDLKFML